MANQHRSSRLTGFYKLGVRQRLGLVQRFADLDDHEVATLEGGNPQVLAQASRMIENVGGLFHFPVGFAANFRIDDRDVLVPMVIEEPSVVAASSNAARLMRGGPGIVTDATSPVMIGQIQLCNVPDLVAGKGALEAAAPELVERANVGHNRLLARGGGAIGLRVRVLPESMIGPMLVVHLHVDVCDAMGANLVNTMVENIAQRCEALSGGKAFLRILSNLADQRLVWATGRVKLASLERPQLGWDGREVAERIERASVFAEVDPYRAATHNKGIMNGVDAFLLATGQDWRAVEAGAHAHACRHGRYGAMSTWRVEGDELVGRLEMPMQVGIVGGVTRVHPVVKVLLKVVQARTASDIGRIAASVGLAQNLAAIMALATEGIQRGHMSLHARNIAAAAGARDSEIDRVVAEMIRRHTITHDAAEDIMRKARVDVTQAVQGPLTIDELRSVRDKYWPDIEALLEEIVPRGDGSGSFADIFWYQFDTGGKRVRAVIPLMVCAAMGQDPQDAVPFSAAMELLHNATLMESDADDRLRTRRGRDTAWVRYGRDQAAGCADGMLFAALACLDHLQRPAATKQRLSRLVTQGMLTVIRAQVDALRMDARRSQDDDDAIVELVRDRTGGLFALAVTGGALLAQAEESSLSLLETIGGHLGVMFQVQDELLGIVGGFSNYRRGATIIDGTAGIIMRHCLSHCSQAERAELEAIIARGHGQTTDEDIRRAIDLMRTHGSLAYGAGLFESTHTRLMADAVDLPQPGLMRLLSGIADIFLAPLVARFDLEAQAEQHEHPRHS